MGFVNDVANMLKGALEQISYVLGPDLRSVFANLRFSNAHGKSGEMELQPLHRLGIPQQALFLASAGERIWPFYERFSLGSTWGDVPLMRESLDTVWAYLEGKFDDTSRLVELAKRCANKIPEFDDQTSENPEYVIDVAAIVIGAMLCIAGTDNPAEFKSAFYLAREAIENYVLDTPTADRLGLGPWEAKTDPVFLEHVRLENELIDRLQNSSITTELVAEVRQRAIKARVRLFPQNE